MNFSMSWPSGHALTASQGSDITSGGCERTLDQRRWWVDSEKLQTLDYEKR
jgi:hypothetical protein